MSEGYNIKISLDTRGATRELRSFGAALNDNFKALREFDARAKNAFKSLDQFSKLNTSNMTRSMKNVDAAIQNLNRIKVNRALVNDLSNLRAALSGIKFTGGDSLKKLPEALKGLNAIKINASVITSLNELKAATKGFTGPPKSLAEWPKIISKFSGAKIGTSLPTNLTALKIAMRGFSGPSKSAMNLPRFLKQLSTHRISPALATNLAALKASVSGFTGPSARAGTNLASLLNAMKGVNVAQINQIAAALQRLNGIRISIGSGNGLSRFQSSLGRTNSAMRDLAHQSSVLQAAMGTLQAAVGGVSLVGFAQSIYATGAAYQSLQRTLGSVAASQEEVASHLQFIDQLTTKMPISIEAAATSYKKFAVAAGLSGMSIKDTQETFENFSTGFSAMGLSVEAQKYAFIALEQMISKGQVQMEELKTQLGDHLPGAVQLMATALDVPVAKLMKMIEAGQVTSDAVIKMGRTVKTQFGEAAAAAVNSTQGQFTALQNAWWTFKNTIFNSGFDAALGAMAKSLSDIMSSDAAIDFAKRIGDAFSRAFKAIAVGAAVLADNQDTVVKFFKAFAAYSAVIAAGQAMRLLSSPVLLAASAFALLTTGSKEAGVALMLLGGVQIIKGITAIGGALNTLSSRVFAVTAGVVLLAAGLDAVFNDGRATEAMARGLKSVIDYMGGAFAGMGNSMGNGLGAIYDKAGEAAEKFAADQEKIADSNLTFDKTMAHNAEERARQEREKLVTLTAEATKLWELINPIGKANEEYQKQLGLLDEIAKKRGLTDEQKDGFKRVLDAQTLDDRNPLGGGVKELQEELAAVKAKTAEQKAFNDAKKFENDMLKKGVALSQEQVRTVQDYYEGVAKMNGELGNGIERWAASVGDFNDNMHEAVKDSIGDLSHELAAFATGAEADFSKLAQSILQKFAQIALDSMLKDVFGAMGMDGEKNGASVADKALEKLAGMGETITTANTNVYTSGLTIDGQPLGGLSPLAPQPVIPVERKELPLIPGTTQMEGPSALNPLAVPKNTEISTLKESATNAFTDAAVRSQSETVKLDTSSMNYLAGSLNTQGQASLDTIDIKGAVQKAVVQDTAGPGIDPTTTGALGQQNYQALSLPEPKGNRDWLNQMYARGRSAGLPDTQARLMASQAALESGYGKSGLTQKANNFFGMKAGKSWQGDTVTMRTREEDANGNSYYENARFRKYGSMEEGLLDKERMMSRNWPDAMKATSFDEATDGLRNGRFGAYATDKNYASKLASMNAKIDPYAYATPPANIPNAGEQPQGIDPTVTNSITQANAELTKTGSTMQQVSTATQQANTTQQSSAQQAQLASQQKVMASQTETMSTQQAAMGMQQAGVTAQQVGPQFMQAGTQIGQAGQQAQQAGMAASTAQPGLGSFGSGITGLLGPLASAVPGLGQFGGAIMSLLSSLASPMGGGGGLLGGLFKEGGYATSPVSVGSMPASAWSGAPQYAEGTANTSGGMPAILHPNEAVIPLSRGRSIPVDLGGGTDSGRKENLDNTYASGMNGRPIVNLNITTPDVASFRKSKRQMALDAASVAQRAQARS